ncbi:MAG: hypothetical protein ABWZ88_13910 [Variovorax sp.]
MPAPAPVAEAPAPSAKAPAPVAEAPAPAPDDGGSAPAPAPAPDNGGSAPAPAPAPDTGGSTPPPPPPAPAPAAPKTWKDADCSHAGAALPACSTNFSDNDARVGVVADNGVDVIQLETGHSPNAPTRSANNAVYGNKAVYGLTLLDKVKLTDFPGISFKMKLNNLDTTTPGDAYVNYVISRDCTGTAASWLNLVTVSKDMLVGGPDRDGYFTYTARIDEVKWAKTGTKAFPDETNPLLFASNGAGGVSTLQAFTDAYPEACIYNFPHPSAVVTPAVVINLGQSTTDTDKKSWVKELKIGTVSIF